MKIALFSDVHANLPAFEAFLQDLDNRKPDAAYCLGDLIGYNVWPNEVVDEIRKRGMATLSGNHDLKVKNLITLPHHLNEEGKGYAYHLVNASNRAYLATLPAHIKLEYKLQDEPLNIILAHGSTRNVNEYVLENFDEAYILGMIDEADADVLCVGHSHKPFHRTIKTGLGTFKHVINIGSVGKPKDGDPRGCYVLLTLTEECSLHNRDSIKVEFIRFDYDVEKAAKAVEDSLLPNEFADMLRRSE